MTNEELIARIRGGANGYYADLYRQNRGMIALCARKYVSIDADPALTVDDFMQEGYIALVAAAEAYEPEKGSFVTLLSFYLRKHMRELAGIRTTRRRAHRDARSLNTPIDEESDDEFIDFIEDPSALEAFDAAERMESCATIREAVSRMRADTRSVIEAHYGIGRRAVTLIQAAKALGLTYHKANQLHRAGLRELRRNGSSAAWRMNSSLRAIITSEPVPSAQRGQARSSWRRCSGKRGNNYTHHARGRAFHHQGRSV